MNGAPWPSALLPGKGSDRDYLDRVRDRLSWRSNNVARSGTGLRRERLLPGRRRLRTGPSRRGVERARPGSPPGCDRARRKRGGRGPGGRGRSRGRDGARDSLGRPQLGRKPPPRRWDAARPLAAARGRDRQGLDDGIRPAGVPGGRPDRGARRAGPLLPGRPLPGGRARRIPAPGWLRVERARPRPGLHERRGDRRGGGRRRPAARRRRPERGSAVGRPRRGPGLLRSRDALRAAGPAAAAGGCERGLPVPDRRPR